MNEDDVRRQVLAVVMPLVEAVARRIPNVPVVQSGTLEAYTAEGDAIVALDGDQATAPTNVVFAGVLRGTAPVAGERCEVLFYADRAIVLGALHAPDADVQPTDSAAITTVAHVVAELENRKLIT